MANVYEGELEMELEDEFHEGEFEGEDEAGLEGEGWLGALGNIAGSLLGESEDEFEGEDEFEDEGEGEGWLGALGNVAGSLLGESEDEYELEGEFEDETEEFSFGGIGKFLKKAAPMLKSIAKVAAPLVGTAVLGPAGGALLGKAANTFLNESEFEGELEEEQEFESESEMYHEISSHPISQNEAVAEMMAEAASYASQESEAEAMMGAAVASVLSHADRRALRRVLPHMVRGTAILTRILRRRRATRPALRAVPTIVRRTVKDLKRQAAKGLPITHRRTAVATAKQVRRVLGSPKASGAAIKRNLKVSRIIKRAPKRRRYSTMSTARRRRMAVR